MILSFVTVLTNLSKKSFPKSAIIPSSSPPDSLSYTSRSFQVNEGFIYTCSGNLGASDYIQCEQYAMENVWDHIFSYGNISIDDNKVYFGRTNSIGVYDRHGK